MPKIERTRPEDVSSHSRHLAPSCRAQGRVTSRLLSPEHASLWLVASALAAGTRLVWDPQHGDEALYVQPGGGALRVDGRPCTARAAVVIEAGACPVVECETDTRVLHFGSHAPPPAAGGGRVHVTTARGSWELLEPGRETRFFADASCDSCRAWLLYTARAQAFESQVHSHSQDELIHVLEGEICLGSLRIGPGETLFIAADQLYQLRAGDAGFAFLNYRRDASHMRVRGREERLLESGATTGMRRVAPTD